MSLIHGRGLLLNLCEHCGGRVEPRLRVVSNGGKSVWPQCTACGELGGERRALKLEMFDLAALSPWDERLRTATHDVRQVAREAQRESRQQEWDERYYAHLESAQWKELRCKVIAREHGICQGCGVADAREVHHATYQHLGDEFLFELLLLCGRCHERYHMTNRTIT